MSEIPSDRMSVDGFLVWAENRPGRYELVDGQVIAMAPERIAYGRAKAAAFNALAGAVRQSHLACEALPDGMTVRIDSRTAYEPDALVYCGTVLPGDALEVAEPVVIVEILSPGARRTDTGAKLAGYFTLPSVHHYLVVDADHRRVLHHARGEAGVLNARILGSGTLHLDPPGLILPVASLYGEQG